MGKAAPAARPAPTARADRYESEVNAKRANLLRRIAARVSGSLPAKAFLLVAGLLTASSIAIYLVVAAVVPGSYDSLAEAYARDSVNALASDVAGDTVDEAFSSILSYCIDNNAFASLSVGGQTIAFGTMPDDRESAYTFTTTIELAGGARGALTVVDASSSAERFSTVFLRLFPPVLLIILAVSGAGAWLASRMIARPIVRIEEGARRMSDLDLTWRCEDARTDEVGSLGRSLNDMAEKLSATMGELEDANERLVRDAADAQARERERRDFFAAASHELKTPLAIIRSQVEGMMMGIGDFADRDKHLPHVLDAATRMEALVGDMLAIARTDAGGAGGAGAGVSFAPLDAADAVSAAVDRARPLAEARGIVIDVDGSLEPCRVEADARLLAKALDNIVGNAVVHTAPGARVTVRLKGGALTVENPSDPIPPDAMARLAEPFFRADESRSAKTGGSGLGLYIAKTALDLHGFALDLACEGGTFTARVAFGA